MMKKHILRNRKLKNYYAQIKADYPAVASYLASLGVDIEKPFDVSPLEPENGILEYCACWYIVFGSCPDNYRHKIGDADFGVVSAHPSTGIEDELPGVTQYKYCIFNNLVLEWIRD